MKMSSFNYPPQDDGEPQYASSGSSENHMPDDDDPNWDGYKFYPQPNQGEAQDQPGYAGFNEDYQEQKNDIYGKIMLSGILVFIFIILLAILLHVYARWFWRQSARFPNRNRRRSSSIRHRFNFIEEEPVWLRNVGLQSAVLETLPIFVYKSQDFTDGLECAVCLCEFEENEKARLLPNCRHNFHVECIDMWFRSHSTCPLCRTRAEPLHPILESLRTEQVWVTIPEPIPSGTADNRNSEERPSASSGEDDNRQNPTNILHWDKQKQINAEMDEGTSGGRKTLMVPQIGIDIPKRTHSFSFRREAHQLCSPNGSQSFSRSPVNLLRSLSRMLSREARIQAAPTDHPGQFDVENNGPAQEQ